MKRLVTNHSVLAKSQLSSVLCQKCITVSYFIYLTLFFTQHLAWPYEGFLIKMHLSLSLLRKRHGKQNITYEPARFGPVSSSMAS